MEDKQYKTAIEYGHDFIEITHRMKRLLVTHAGKHELYHGEFMTLGVIESIIKCNLEKGIDKPGAKVGEIAKRLRSTKSATSKMLRSLEEKNYIERASDKNDRRTVYIRFSDVGEKIIKDHKQRMDDFVEEVVKELGIKKMDDLIQTFHQLYDIMTCKIDHIFQEDEVEDEDSK